MQKAVEQSTPKTGISIHLKISAGILLTVIFTLLGIHLYTGSTVTEIIAQAFNIDEQFAEILFTIYGWISGMYMILGIVMSIASREE